MLPRALRPVHQVSSSLGCPRSHTSCSMGRRAPSVHHDNDYLNVVTVGKVADVGRRLLLNDERCLDSKIGYRVLGLGPEHCSILDALKDATTEIGFSRADGFDFDQIGRTSFGHIYIDLI